MKSRHVILRSEGIAVIEDVCERLGVRVDRVLSRYRYAPLVEARREIALILRDFGWSTPQIGALLRRDHSTIVTLTAPAGAKSSRAFKKKLYDLARDAKAA